MQINNAEEANYKAQALSFQRILVFMHMLKADLSFAVSDRDKTLKTIAVMYGKTSDKYKNAKEYFDAHSFGFDAVNNAMRRIDKSVKDRNRANFLKESLTKDRISDLHEFFDQALEVDNISVLTKIIEAGLEKTRSENSQSKCITL